MDKLSTNHLSGEKNKNYEAYGNDEINLFSCSFYYLGKKKIDSHCSLQRYAYMYPPHFVCLFVLKHTMQHERLLSAYFASEQKKKKAINKNKNFANN
ncbi:hypothetical protein POVCU2_0001900 [Plasmodium ovale curtisi]|uniref:Uncharacterized protein n=1 Tax=Plasmodium ovale curtisi TaxID=864141 RepID=A0A1A8X979_PLAOA|nr:hypothetical protein POVCU2_0001900 [Plasmodium ovale curtisi]SBT00824.1 hypothetical protein POVCU1_062610 [Plasmodium ovale curtisi]